MFFLRHIIIIASLFVVLCIAITAAAQSLPDCQVLNPNGEDVTTDLLFQDNDNQVVVCEGNFACQNFTITNCLSVRCIGTEACFQTTMKEIGELVECQEKHSCHRANVQFRENDSSKSIVQQSMTCQGEGACDVAEIYGSSLHLECFGHKACRKIKTRVDTIHCTHGDTQYDACTEYARIQANCILCGYMGCDGHVNYCATKPIDAPEEQRWMACLPEQAVGEGCTAEQIQALANEIQTKGQVMSAEKLDPSQTNTNDNEGNK